jgi:hypothetical protein
LTSTDLVLLEDPVALLEAVDDREQFVLVALDQARVWLVTANGIGQVFDVRARAEAIRVYPVQAHLGREAEKAASEIRLRAEHRVGELVKEGQEAGEIARKGRPVRKATPSVLLGTHKCAPPAYLAQLGITAHESSEFQALADIPPFEFDEIVAVLRADGKLTRSAVLRMWEQKNQESNAFGKERTAEGLPTGGEVVNTAFLVRLGAVQAWLRDLEAIGDPETLARDIVISQVSLGERQHLDQLARYAQAWINRFLCESEINREGIATVTGETADLPGLPSPLSPAELSNRVGVANA